MGGFLTKIFSSGIGETVEKVGGVLDNLITTKEEKAEAMNKINEIFLDHEAKMLVKRMAIRCKQGNVKRLTLELMYIALGKLND